MLPIKARRVSRLVAVCLLPLSLLVGCSSWEWDSTHGGKWVPKELPDADRAVEAARQAGKDRECPEQFKAAEALRDEAWAKYHRCLDEESIALAREAAAKAAAPCPPRVVAEPRPAPAPRPRACSRADRVSHREPGLRHRGPVRVPDVVVEPGLERFDRAGHRQGRVQRVPAGLPRQHDAIHGDRRRRGRVAHVLDDGGRETQGRGQADHSRQLRLQQVDGPQPRTRPSCRRRSSSSRSTRATRSPSRATPTASAARPTTRSSRRGGPRR